MIGRKASVLGLLLYMLLLSSPVLTDKRPGKHTHDEKAPQGQTMGGHTHKHDAWEPPPLEYADARSTRWDDPAAARGEALFQTYCLVCRDADGRGTGPAAVALPHAPADLTHHSSGANAKGHRGRWLCIVHGFTGGREACETRSRISDTSASAIAHALQLPKLALQLEGRSHTGCASACASSHEGARLVCCRGFPWPPVRSCSGWGS
jgi:hypothetical protein